MLVLIFFLLAAGSGFAADGALSGDDLPRQEILRLGERMDREGILPSGEPMQAVVMGDIPVDARMFTCDDCHQRSGLGSVEGTVITWPTNGRELDRPRRLTGAWRPPEGEVTGKNIRKLLPAYWRIKDVRPPYTDESLAVVLRTGIDPAGRKLNPVMPLYLLDDKDMAVLVYYLKNLSVEISPGVDKATLYFATIITDDVPENDRQAMLSALQAHIDARNSQTRHQERRSASGPFYKTESHQSYRRMHLDVWELSGPENTWPEQLETYYRQKPVFALLGGITTGSWQQIHHFCEENRIPAIFPITDLPVISDTDWYTLYFSKGLYQEGEATARFIHSRDIGEEGRIIMLAGGDDKNQALRRGFAETWQKLGNDSVEYIELAADRKPDGRFWRDLTAGQPAVLILWLEPGDLEAFGGVARRHASSVRMFISSRLLETASAAIPDEMRDRLYISWPRSLPDLREKRMTFVRQWFKARGVKESDIDIQADIYALGWIMPGSIKRMRSEYFREYFLEGFDMMIDQYYAIPGYPRLTFGPGQRYASKGCYIVQLTGGPDPEIVPKSDWVIH